MPKQEIVPLKRVRKSAQDLARREALQRAVENAALDLPQASYGKSRTRSKLSVLKRGSLDDDDEQGGLLEENDAALEREHGSDRDAPSYLDDDDDEELVLEEGGPEIDEFETLARAHRDRVPRSRMQSADERVRLEADDVAMPSERERVARDAKSGAPAKGAKRQAEERSRRPHSETRRRSSRPARNGGSRRTVEPVAGFRFKLATVLRISDNLVARVVSMYEGLFRLDEREQADIYLDMGREFLRSGKLEEALVALRKAALANPEDPAPLIEIGKMQLKRRAPLAAIRTFRRAIEAGHDTYAMRLLLAEAFVGDSKFEEAVEQLTRAAEHQPDVADVHYRLGLLEDKLGRHDAAIVAFQRCLELVPDDVAYLQSLGFALECVGRRNEAIGCFKKALEFEQTQDRRRSRHARA
jgi:tetratricopeptide (TPR) repeat protein